MKLGYNDLLRSFNENNGELSITIPDNWMQGRTTYGGLSAALCLEAVYKKHSKLPTLRSAQVNFIGPASGRVSINTRVLREGKSVSFIEAEMKNEKEILTHAVFCFGAERKSKLNHIFGSPPNYKSVEDSASLLDETFAPAFTQHFDCRLAKGKLPFFGSNKHEHSIWVRLKEQAMVNPVLLLAIGDMPPPAISPMFKELAPASSINWTINFIQNKPKTKKGWWLIKSSAEDAQDGYSSQDMQMWNDSGELVLTSRQSVAYFY